MNRLTGAVLCGSLLGGSYVFSNADSVGGRVIGVVVASPAWGYYVYRVVREIRGIKEDWREFRLRREERKSLKGDELIDAIAQLVTQDPNPGSRPMPLECGMPGHGPGHRCLAVSRKVTLADLIKDINGRYGPLRNLAMGGYVDPMVDATTGLPLLTPFGPDVVDMRAWGYGSWWIGAGTVRSDGYGDAGSRRVVLVTERPRPR